MAAPENDNDDEGLLVFPAPNLDSSQWSAVRRIINDDVLAYPDEDAPCHVRFVDAPAPQADWIATAREAARVYRAMPLDGFTQNMFLYVDQRCVDSILNAKGQKASQGGGPPFVFAVERHLGKHDDSDNDGFRGWFKVHMRWISELYRCVEGQALDPVEIGGDLGEDDVFMAVGEKYTAR